MSTQTEILARAFADKLKEWLTPEQMAEVVERNEAEHHPGICHSHDFCDSNEAMMEAFESFMGREMRLDDEDTDGNDQRASDEAWLMAKRNGFWIK